MGLSKNGRSANCWVCGAHSIVVALAELAGQPTRAIVPLLTALAGSVSPDPDFRRGTGRLALPRGVQPLLGAHKDYLRKRDLNPDEVVEMWSIQGIGLSSRLAWRLFIPVHDHKGETVSWTTRAISDKVTKRYINAKPEEERTPIKNLLFGEHLTKHAVLVCEGPLDAMRVGPGACATFGTSVTAQQKAKLAKFPVRFIAFDREDNAQRVARELARDLSVYPGSTTLVKIRSAKDPSAASKQEIKELRSLLI